MYRAGATMISPKKVIRLLREANVRFVLMGTHGIGGWRSEPRATQDVDVLVVRKDHTKAVRILHEAFPKLIVEEGVVVTRFKNPKSGEPLINVMKPLQAVFRMTFKYTVQIRDSHRIPDLEMALASKFAAMVSPNRAADKKFIDAGDFINIVRTNEKELDIKKLRRLGEKVYRGGGAEVVQLVDDIKAGKQIQL
jgi:hypothetical protein